jgi:DNA modification methylase
MQTFTLLDNTCRKKLPTRFSCQEEIRMPETEVEFILNAYTKPGDAILDIFAGFGTTLLVSEEMGRIPFGIEYDKAKFEFIREHLSDSFKNNVFHGDCRQIEKMDIPPIDFLITSPPFCRKEDCDAPLTDYNSKGTYSEYLQGIHDIFKILRSIVKPNGYLVVEASNMKNREAQTVTTLAWDIGHEIAKSHTFLGEVIVAWNNNSDKEDEEGAYGYGYDHSYCLVYQNNLSN